MNLTDYPTAIEAEAYTLAEINEDIESREQVLETLTDSYIFKITESKDAVSGKPKYPNEQARELALRDRQRNSKGWSETYKKTQAAKRLRTRSIIRLERLRNDFTVEKLVYRAQVAQTELAAQ